MLQVTLIGGTIVIALALLKDANGTIQLVTAIITIRGVTWLCKKMMDGINKDYAEIINFAGWSLSGVSAINVLKNSIGGFHMTTQPILVGVQGIQNLCLKIGELADKLTFWN